MNLPPVSERDIDARLIPHIEPGETLLWQAQPEIPSISNWLGILFSLVGILAGLVLLLGLGPVVYPPLAMASGSSMIPGLSVLAFSGVFLFAGWQERDSNWRFGITDRRLLLVRGNKLIRSVLPGELRRVRIKGNLVYWHQEVTAGSGSAARNRRDIGFRGMRDPEAVKAGIEAWREGFSQRAAAVAAAYTSATRLQDAGDQAITRVEHPQTGLSIDVPSGWQIMVSNDYDGPLRLFGLTILSRIILPREERAYGDGKPWTTLKVRGAPDAGLYLVVRSTPLTQTLDDVVNDRWNKQLGLEFLGQTPDLKIGPFEGFSVRRKVPGGAMLTGFGRVNSPVATRMVWLGRGDTSVELTGMARLDQTQVQEAINAMVDSLSC